MITLSPQKLCTAQIENEEVKKNYSRSKKEVSWGTTEEISIEYLEEIVESFSLSGRVPQWGPIETSRHAGPTSQLANIDVQMVVLGLPLPCCWERRK